MMVWQVYGLCGCWRLRRNRCGATARQFRSTASSTLCRAKYRNRGTTMCNDRYLAIAPDVVLGRDVKLAKFINLYGCQIGDETKIGAFVEVQKNATIGKRCKISSHTFICEGVEIEDGVFIGHGVTFINDSYPRAVNHDGTLQT